MRARHLVLVAVAGLLWPATARAQNIDLPSVPLPATEPAAPSLWFSPAELPAFQARRTSATGAPHFNATRSFVDGRLSTLANSPASISDDTLTQVAKGAALLQALGETPASGAFASYRDVAVAAIKNVGDRVPVTIFNAGSPPANAIDVLQDSPRLQSMAEAYDLLRGSGVASADDSALRTRIDNWAQALHDDLNLAGAFGVAGHRDNWGIKGGSALITTALSLSSHAHASGWMSFGNTLVHDSFVITGSSAGWYRESAHYLNYALGQCFSTAVHALRRTGVDWFVPLEPFARAALDVRQPDGSEAAFEEGVPAVFPFDVFAPRSATLGGHMAWAWTHSSKDTDNWGNQQLAAATQFLAGELPPEVAPAGRPSRFVEGDAHLSALRSGFDAQAVQATLFAARDHSASTLVSSRHNMQNPLDLTVAGLGRMLLPTSGGGPQVTSSSKRSYYLTPASKNLPLVNGTAPFVTDAAQIAVDQRLAGQDEGGQTGRYLELVRTKITGAYAAPVTSVSRTVALLGGAVVAVQDDIVATSSVPVALALHGRGTRTTPAGSALLQTSWSVQGVALDLTSISVPALTLAAVPGNTTIAYGTEESVDGIELRGSGARVRALTLLVPRTVGASALAVEDRSSAAGLGVLALRTTAGDTIDHLASASANVFTSVDTLATDASFSSVREIAGAWTSFGLAEATRLTARSVPLFESDRPMTLSVTFAATGLLAELSPDQQGASTFFLAGPASFEPGLAVRATFNGQPLGDAQLTLRTTGYELRNLAGGGTLRLEQGARVLEPVAPRTIAEGETLAFTLSAVPPPNETLTFSMTPSEPLPAGNTPSLDPATGAFSWTPDHTIATRAGPRDLVFTFVARGNGFMALQPFALRVVDANKPPVIAPLASQTARRGSSFVLQPTGSDPDGDALLWSFAATPPLAPPGPALDAPTGRLTWDIPIDAPLGTLSLAFTASDGLDFATTSTTLTIAEQNHPPRFTLLDQKPLTDPVAASLDGKVGLALKAELTAVDDDGDGVELSAPVLPAGATWTRYASAAAGSAMGRLDWTPGTAGDQTIRVRATDTSSGQSELVLTVHVASSQTEGEAQANARGCGGCAGGGTPGLEWLLGLGLLSSRRRRL